VVGVYRSPAYPQPSAAEIESFVAQQFCGKVIAVDAEGFPHVSILPFVKQGDRIEVHMVRADPTLQALEVRPEAGFLLDEPLAFTPHQVIDPSDAGFATLHFLCVHFRVRARVQTDPVAVAAALERLLRHYEPDATWEPVVDGPRYGPRLRQLAAVELAIAGVEAKFKVAQNRSAAQRERLLAYLAQRNLPGDGHAAARIRSAVATDPGRPAPG
jgi:transcriptional regulator